MTHSTQIPLLSAHKKKKLKYRRIVVKYSKYFESFVEKILVSMLDARGPSIRQNFELVSAIQLANKCTV